MNDIYFLVVLVLTAIGTFFAGVYAKPLARFYKRLFTRKKRNTLARIEWLEGRTKIHDNKDKVYLDKFDELEKQINNLSKTLSMREKNRDNKVKKAVLEYLKELQK